MTSSRTRAPDARGSGPGRPLLRLGRRGHGARSGAGRRSDAARLRHPPRCDRPRRRVLAPRHAQHRLPARPRSSRPPTAWECAGCRTTGRATAARPRSPAGTSRPAAADTAAVADALGIDRLAVMGHSGGGPHAIACGALLADRVIAVVSTAGLAPFEAEGLDWFAGMAASGVASLRAAAAGRSAKERFEASGVEYDPEFTPADLAVLEGDWSWLGDVVGPAVAAGPGGLIDDDLAYVRAVGLRPGRGGRARPDPARRARSHRAQTRTANGSPATAPRPSSGSLQRMATCRSSPRPPRRWSGSGRRPGSRRNRP